MSHLDYFSQCWDLFRSHIDKSQYTSPQFEDYLHTGGVPYGTSWKSSFELLTKKGNVSKKAFHVSIYRTENGLYEPNFYIL